MTDKPTDAEIRRLYGDDLDALTEQGYLETWIDDQTGAQKYRMTTFGLYETTAGPLAGSYSPGGDDTIARLAEQAAAAREWCDESVLRAWLADMVEGTNDRLSDPEAFVEEHSE